MRIAIIGATSQIAKDLIFSFSKFAGHDLILFARNPEAVAAWLGTVNLADKYGAPLNYDAFGVDQHFDAVMNFVGVGNPAQAQAMGAAIFDVTYQYDELVLNYIKQYPQCRYLFLSSGAAYGTGFNEPVDSQSKAIVPINNLQPQDWYAVAKLYAECRHRAQPQLPIIDIRVFNYVSCSQDLSARFLICDILRAIQEGSVLETSSIDIVRDYLHPDDFYRLVDALLSAPCTNAAVDCYSKSPISKFDLLEAAKAHFGLKYEVIQSDAGINSTGVKPHYYSKNHLAAEFGYEPEMSSIEGIVKVMKVMLSLSPVSISSDR